MTLRVEVWQRPGGASFGKKIADLPVLSGSFSRRRNGVADGSIVVPNNYPRLTEIYDPPDGASYGGVSSLLRVFDGSTLVAELLPSGIIPSDQKGNHTAQIDCIGIEGILSYGRLEPFDWSGADSEQSLFPDWLFGAENLIDDGDFENLGIGAVYQLYVGAETYSLTVTATGGTFTLTVGANTTAAIAFDASAGTIESALEAIASVTDVEATEFEDGSIRIRFVDPENVSPDMSINTGSLTGGSASLNKVDDGFSKSGTTFTLTVDGDTTPALDWDVSALGIENNLQGLSTVADVTVEGVGHIDDPWVIVFYDPIAPPTFTVDDAGLSGGTAYLTELNPAVTSVGRWTVSQFADERRDVAQHGSVSTFQLSTTAHSGDYSLQFTADRQFGGVQRVFNVKPGATMQASIWVRASSAADRFRIVFRAVIDELDNPIAGFPSDTGEFTLTANTWTEITFTDMQIPPGVDEILLRFAYVGTGPMAGTAFIDDVVVYEGLPAGTPGYILRTLYEDMVDDHGTGNDIYWDNGAGSPYLTLDFSDTVDSDGAAWTNSDVAIEFLKGQSFLNCLTALASSAESSGPLSWEIVPNSVSAGTYYLRAYNNGGAAAWDLSGDDDCPVVRGGKDAPVRSVRRFTPDATDMAVEGADLRIARARNTAAVAALGKIGGYVPAEDLPDLTVAANTAATELAVRLTASQSLAYTVVPDASGWRPLVDYVPGYTILVEDEPLIAKSAHEVDAVRVGWAADGPVEYQVHFDSESFVGNEALAEGVRKLLSVFKGIRPKDPNQTARGGSGVLPFLVAASDSLSSWKSIAGWVCSGTNDQETIQAAIDSSGGYVALSPGFYQITSQPSAPAISLTTCRLEGLGNRFEVDIEQVDSGKTSPGAIFQMSGGATLQNVYIYAEDTDCIEVFDESDVLDCALEIGTSGSPITEGGVCA